MKKESSPDTFKKALLFGENYLIKHYPESPRIDSEMLLLSLLSISSTELLLNPHQNLGPENQKKFLKFLKRRGSGEPIAYILGYKDFFKYQFKVSEQVLIPRPETEELVEFLIQKVQASTSPKNPLIVDLGIGSGCIGLSLLKSLPQATLVGVDISAEALKIVQQNANSLGLIENKDYFLFHQPAEDILQFQMQLQTRLGRSEIDLLVANPPYIAMEDPLVEINVKKFEPSLALFAKDQGYEFLFKWTQAYAPWIAKGGLMMMEMGHTQSALVLSHLKSLNLFENIEVIKDFSKVERFIYADKIKQ